jgi:hypothetical protein
MGKVWKSVKKVFKKAAPVVGAIAGNAILPGIGGAMAGAFLGSVVAGNNTRQHLFSAGAAGIGAGVAGAGAGAAGQAGTQTAAQAGTQATTQAATQAATQATTQTFSQAAAQEATKATFTEAAKQTVAKYGTEIAIGTAANTGVALGTKVKTPKVDNSEEVELMKREKEYEKRKRSSLFETKGGAAGERVGYTGSENRGSIFGN